MKKIFTLIAAMLLVPWVGWGQEENRPVEQFGLSVTGPEGSFTFHSDNGHILQIQGNGVTVTNTKDGEGNIISADCKITINCTKASEENPVTVIFDNVYIKPKTKDATPISVEHGNDVTLTFKGNNKIESPDVHEKGDGTMAIIQGESNGSLTITGAEGEESYTLEVINNSLNKHAIGGGSNTTINIKNGTIKTNYGGIGGSNSTINIFDDVKIEMANPENGLYGNAITVGNADIDIIYNESYPGGSAGVGINMVGTKGTLSMTGGTFDLNVNRDDKNATGIRMNTNTVTISGCTINMKNVSNGIIATKTANASIKDNSFVKIEATDNAIDSNIDISDESVILLYSEGKGNSIGSNGCAIRVGLDANLTTNDGNAYIVADAVNSIVAKDDPNPLFPGTATAIISTDRTAWKGIVFERDENLDGILSGYVYGDITMQTNAFELKDNYHLIYCNPDKGKLTIGEKGELPNNGHIFIAYDSQKQNIEKEIKGNGTYHYEVFYDESVNVPEELKNNLKDAILSDELMRKMNHPNAGERTEMIFGESEKAITLSIDEEKYPDYKFTFKVKPMSPESTTKILVEGNTFTMPAEAVLVYDITIEKKVEKYIAKVDEGITGGTVTIGEGVQEAEFEEGATVGVNIDPADGYVLDEVFYVGNGEKTPITEIDRFTMPAYDVIIYVTFKESQGGDDEGDDDSTSGAYKKRFRLYLANEDYFPKDCEEDYELEGLVLFSRHDKKYTHAGGSFTIWYEQFGEPNVGNYRVFWSKTAKGEYEEVKFDEVSEYFQIRDVHSNVFVKLYYETGFPVSNETIEATEARAYAQPNKIVVITPEPTEVQIISMAGAVVATAQVAGQQEFANLTEGVYIVRMGEDIVKLQVRN